MKSSLKQKSKIPCTPNKSPAPLPDTLVQNLSSEPAKNIQTIVRLAGEMAAVDRKFIPRHNTGGM